MPTWPAGVSADRRLQDFIRAFLSRLLRDDVPAWHRHLIMREVADPRPGACEELVQEFIRPTFEMFCPSGSMPSASQTVARKSGTETGRSATVMPSGLVRPIA